MTAFLQKKHMVRVLRILSNGDKSFNQILSIAKMSPSILSKRLLELRRFGMATRIENDNGGRIKQYYKLTDKGRELSEVAKIVSRELVEGNRISGWND